MLQRTLIFLDGVIVGYFLFEMFLKVCCSLSYVTNTLFCDWVSEREREGEREGERWTRWVYNSTFPCRL